MAGGRAPAQGLFYNGLEPATERPPGSLRCRGLPGQRGRTMQIQPYRDDESLLDNIRAALKKHSELSGLDIFVNIKNGEAFLRGTLENKDQRRRILTTVRGVHGVRTIREELKVAEAQSRLLNGMKTLPAVGA